MNYDISNPIINEIKSDIAKNKDELKSVITNTEKKLTNIIEDLKRKVNNLEEENNKLKNKLEQMERKSKQNKIVIFGFQREAKDVSIDFALNELNKHLNADIKKTYLNNLICLGNHKNCPVKIDHTSQRKRWETFTHSCCRQVDSLISHPRLQQKLGSGEGRKFILSQNLSYNVAIAVKKLLCCPPMVNKKKAPVFDVYL
ncbi:hypothetical protein NQ318_012998 [Aromia moschata]|uniref:Uncharacterized protein n=1 Tax=Aromia moschata TaxID=1265417 RepID=A0AAV8Y318_9CUCU|nr:hypothetical protein NQ318_012998 [Aromia moschata]